MNKFYKGQTNNLELRIERHNTGRETYIRKGVPWILLWPVIKASRPQAMSLERKLKNLDRKRTINFMLKFHKEIKGSDELILINELSGY